LAARLSEAARNRLGQRAKVTPLKNQLITPYNSMLNSLPPTYRAACLLRQTLATIAAFLLVALPTDAVAAPADQDFESLSATEGANGNGSLTIGDLTFSANGSAAVETYGVSSYWGGSFTGHSGKAVIGNYYGSTSTSITYFRFSSVNLADDFRLNSMTVLANEIESGYNYAVKYKVEGFNGGPSGSLVVSVSEVNLLTSGTYGSGNAAITYTRSGSFSSDWANGGSLVFGSAWDNIDTVVFTATDGRAVQLSLDSLDFSAPTPANNAPTDLQLSNASVNQSAGVNATVGTLSTTDPDGDPSFTYTLVAGTGDTDNASFNIFESSLRVNDAGTLAAGDYSVRIQTDDGNGGTYAEAFTVTVTPGTFIWSGAEDAGREWTRPGNWLGNVVPPGGADLLFPADAVRRESINNRPSGFVVRSITIESSFYDIYGESIVLLNGLTTTFDGGNSWFSLNTTLDTVQTFNVATGGELVCFGVFSGSQGLTKTGGGTLRLANGDNNTHLGGTAVGAGTLLLTARNGAVAIPGGLTVADGATVRFHGSTDYDGSTIGENQTAANTSVTLGEGATFDLNGRTNTIAGLTLQGAAVLTGTDGHLTVTGGVTHNASANHVTSTIQGPGVLDLGGGDREFAVANDAGLDVELRVGAVIANGAITKSGAGTLALAGDNTFTGTLTMGTPDPHDFGGSELVNGGRLRAESDNAFGDPATSRTITFSFEMALELAGGITLPATKAFDFEGNGDRIVNVSGSNRILGSIAVAHDSSLNVASGTRLDFDGAITSPSWLYKAGAGTLVFGASSPAFTGRIFANAGTVLVNGSIAGTDQIPVASGATLGGSGTVPVVTLAGGATLAPGNSPGTLSSGNVTFNSGSTFAVELHGTTAGTQYDQLNVTGTVSLGGATLNPTLGYAAVRGDTFVIINNDGADAVVGTFSGLAEGSIFTEGSDRFGVSYIGGDGNDVVLTYDPNSTPTDISLSNSSVGQSGGENATVGTLATTDADGGDSHTYTLVAGTGDTDNASFNISGSTLRANDAGTLAAGNYSIRIQTDDGNGGTYAKSFTLTVVDNVAPTITHVDVPADGTYLAGQNLDFTVHFDETVTVDTGGGTPSLSLTLDTGGTVAADYQGGSGSGALVFRYTVASGTADTDGVNLGSTVSLHGGTIKDAADNDAVLTLNSVASTTGVRVDAVAPTILSIVRLTPAEQVMRTNTVVFAVTFSEDVSGVLPGWFVVTPTNGGTTTGTVASVTGGPSVYEVAVNVASGVGDFRLDAVSPSSYPKTTFATGLVLPVGIAFDSNGNLAVANNSGATLSRVTSEGVVSALATDLPGTPFDVVAGAGGDLFFTAGSHLMKVTSSGVTSVVASNLSSASSVAMGPSGDLYVGFSPGPIMRVTQAGATNLFVTNQFNSFGSAFDQAGNYYTTDLDTRSVYKITADGVVSLVSSDFSFPVELAFDASGLLYVSDFSAGAVKTVDTHGTVSVLATGFSGTTGLAFDSQGELFVANRSAHRIDRLATGGIRDLAGIKLAGLPHTAGELYTYDPNDAPTDIQLSSVAVNESAGAGATVGILTTTDADSGDSHTYTLASGAGDTDNALFTIETDVLKVGASALAAGSYSVRIQTDDGHGGTYAEAFSITVVDDVVPTLTGVAGPTNGTYLAGQNLDFTVTYEEGVSVVGTPSLALTIGSELRSAVYFSGSSTTTLVFRYVVQAGDTDIDGIAAASSLDLNGGSIRDGGGNDAPLAFTPPDTSGVLVDTTAPTVLSMLRKTPAEQVVRTDTVVFEVTFSEAVTGVSANWFVATPINGATTEVMVTSVTGGPSVYEVTVQPTSGAGDFQLDMLALERESSVFATGLTEAFQMAFDGAGNLYVSVGGNTVKKVAADGTVSIFATGFSSPNDLAFDADGNLYVANWGNHTVSRVTPDGVVSTFASGLNRPAGLVFDGAGNLHVSNLGDDSVRKVAPDGVVTVFATGFDNPRGMAFDGDGFLYVANYFGGSISKVDPDGVVSTFATALNYPADLTFGSDGHLYVVEAGGNTVSRFTPGGDRSTFVAGLSIPFGLAFDGDGQLFVGNYGEDSVSRVSPASIKDPAGNPLSGVPRASDEIYTYDPNDDPSDIQLSHTVVNQSGGEHTTVGTLTTTDADEADTHTYALVEGDGDTDNTSFNIFGNLLRANDAAALVAGEYSVRIRTTDNHEAAFEKSFVITVVDDVALVITSAATAGGTYGAAFAYTIAATGGAVGFGATGLPAGLSVASETGAITGTPTQTGVFEVSLSASDAAANAGTQALEITIAKATATIELAGVEATYDGTAKAVSAITTPDGLAVSLTYDGGSVVPVAAGNYAVVATINDDNFAGTAGGTLVIGKAALIATADDASRAYGAGNPAFTGAFTGAVEGDGLSVSYATTATAASAVGTYAIVPAISDPNDKLGNYAVTLNHGTLTVARAVLVATADDQSRAYGVANPELTIRYSGFVNDETVEALGELPVAATVATAASAVGQYAITLSGGSAGNYSFDLVSGTLTVTPAALIATADDASRAYGAGNPEFTGAFTGAIEGDGLSVSYATTATAASAVGTYAIVPAISDPNDKLGNYAVTLNHGTLTVGKAVLVATADDASRPFGQANPVFTGGVEGLVNNDAITVEYTTPATIESPAGTYDIVPVLNDPDERLANYTVTLHNGTLTVTGDDAPVISLGVAGAVYTLRDVPALLAPVATVTDGGSPAFGGGGLVVTVQLHGETLPQDQLHLLADETPGGLTLQANALLVNSVVIGTFTGGFDSGLPLQVTFNHQATPAVAQALVRRLAFATTNGVELATRTVSLQLTDGEGGVSDVVELAVAINRRPETGADTIVTLVNAPVVTRMERLLANDTDPDSDEFSLHALPVVSAEGGMLTLLDGELTYTPPTGFAGLDSFDYVLVDARGGLAAGRVTLKVLVDKMMAIDLLSAINPELAGAGSNDAVVHLAGFPGRTFRVEAADDLAQPVWDDLGLATVDENGLLKFIDPSTYQRARRFFRLLEQAD
jgi:autotransporter-associated beta strand protein